MDSKYCYPGTDILINRFDIKDAAKLHDIERQITNARAVEIAQNPISGKFDMAHLQQIHKKLFSDIYSWAGQIREVRIAKGNVFCYPEFICDMANEIFSKLAKENLLRGLEKERFIDRISFYMGEVNALHPFREGNGRTQRIFFTQLSKAAGYELYFEKMDKELLLEADIEGMAGNYEKLKELLHNNVEKNFPKRRPLHAALAEAKIECDRLNAERKAKEIAVPHKDKKWER